MIDKSVLNKYSAPSVGWWVFLYVHFIVSFSMMVLPYVIRQIPFWIYPLIFTFVWLGGLIFIKLRFNPVPCFSDVGTRLLQNGFIVAMSASSYLYMLVLFSITGWIAILSGLLGIAFLLPEHFVRKPK